MSWLRRWLAPIQVPLLLSRGHARRVWTVYSFINGLITIGILALVAYLTKVPFLFPSLGPTAFLVFSTPALPTASPRNAILGHLVGVVAGYGSLLAFGLAEAPPAFMTGVDLSRVGAASLALAATNGTMVALRVAHPPAAATTLIVALGIMREPAHLVVLMVAVCLLVAIAFIINRVAGLAYPLWDQPAPEARGGRTEPG